MRVAEALVADDGRALHRGLVRALPRLGAAALAAWWMANVGFLTLGVLDGAAFGYGAWLDGFYSFPRWCQGVFAALGVLAWTSGAVVVGGAIALHGARALRRFALGTLACTSCSVFLVIVLTWLWPGDAA